MTLRAIEIKIIGDVIRIGRTVIILLMAGETIAGDANVAARMTGDTFEHQVCSRQRKLS